MIWTDFLPQFYQGRVCKYASRIDYRCMVYGSVRPAALRRLAIIHHSAFRICSGTCRTFPVESLYVICQQLPLHFRRQKISALYFFKAQSVPKRRISQLTLPVSLRRLYAALPSHILPLSESQNASTRLGPS
ncbi:hypothetical protein AVEN_34432-1 [Araneus ventricosus]|uniref:Uncharacterized protein n=1 Tax=Araneus ventricosus TaxID=182803 RepID=A0A4Y2GWN5_ARAVE|nr:hypothetical protein AVEN_34432-1 [Araneus ventricosus]